MEYSSIDESTTGQRPTSWLRLYTPGSVAWATFCGTPLAGGILLAQNYRSLGQAAKARQAVLCSLAGTVALLALVYFVPDEMPNGIFIWPQVIVMYYIAKSLQGAAILSHQVDGGLVHSKWRAVGIGLLTSLPLLVVIAAIVLLTGYGE